MKTGIRAVFCFSLFLIAVDAFADLEPILIVKEIDDDNIIIARSNGENLLLKKWSPRLSPLSFEGKTFYAEVSPMWVTIYIPNRNEIKWSIEKNLGLLKGGQAKLPSDGSLSKVYPGVGSGHWINQVTSGGAMIILEDGSMWQVSPIDRIKSMLWLPVSEITVLASRGSLSYRLLNENKEELVEASYLGSK
jgi:hypothetical protein